MKQSATPSASSSTAPPPVPYLSVGITPSEDSAAPRMLVGAAPPARASASAGLQLVADPNAGPLSEMNRALLEADRTLSQAEKTAPLDCMDWDMEDAASHAWNDPSI